MKKSYLLILIVLVIVLVIVFLGLFLALYEIRLEYYEENKADRLFCLILGPIFLLLLTYELILDYVSNKKRWDFDTKRYLGKLWNRILISTAIFFAFIRPVISGLILLLNANLGYQSEFNIIGKVIDKYEYSGKGAEFELTILSTDKKVYRFDTFGTETRKYEIGDEFNKTMYKGFFGLVYLKNNNHQ